MKKFFLAFVFVLSALVVAAVISCPKREAHEAAVIQEIKSGIVETATAKAGGSLINNIIGNVGASLVNSVSEPLIKSHLEYKDYFVFSVCQFTYDGEPKPLSIGIFGHVITTFSGEDLKNVILKNL